MMPNVDDMFPSKYLKAADLKGGVIDAVMSHVTQEELGKGEMGWVLHFQPNPQLPRTLDGTQLGAVLKTQNADALSPIYGMLTEGWGGKPIQLYIKQTNMGPGIGMRPVAAAFQQVAQMPVTPAPLPQTQTQTQPLPAQERVMGPGEQAAAQVQAPLQPAPQPAQAAPQSDPLPGDVSYPSKAAEAPLTLPASSNETVPITDKTVLGDKIVF